MVRIFSWLLNLVYLAVLLVFSPLIVWQAFRTGKYRDGYARSCWAWCRGAKGTGTASGFTPSASAK